VYNPSGTLVGIYPVPDLQQGKLEEADIDDISGLFAYLYPVAQAKRMTASTTKIKRE
jgi:hypothetical protein